MTDRELLELAAKAAGYYVWTHQNYPDVTFVAPPMRRWDPLTDDGDALRLAVKLGMLLDFIERGYMAWHVVAACYNKVAVYEPLEQGRQAATRRAIVRAAAEIGKTMK